MVIRKRITNGSKRLVSQCYQKSGLRYAVDYRRRYPSCEVYKLDGRKSNWLHAVLCVRAVVMGNTNHSWGTTPHTLYAWPSVLTTQCRVRRPVKTNRQTKCSRRICLHIIHQQRFMFMIWDCTYILFASKTFSGDVSAGVTPGSFWECLQGSTAMGQSVIAQQLITDAAHG